MEILQKVTELKAELDTYRPLDKDQEAAIMQKLRLDWNFHSNHLEGNTLSYGETKALILFGITAAGKPLKDHFEITGHDEAVKWVEEVVKEERPLTESFIRQIHKLILKEPYEVQGKTADGKPQSKKVKIGEYKTTPNHVKTITGEIFRFATPEETPAKMTDLIDWYRSKKEDPESHPLLLAAEFHYKFIRIHPFDDGNGRTARILMNFILMQNAYPPVIVKTEDKQNYFAALRQADAGLIASFIEYIGKNLEQSLGLMIRGAKGEHIYEENDIDKALKLLDEQLKKIGPTRRISKSRKSISDVYNEIFAVLLKSYFEKCQKLKHYYHAIRFDVKSGHLFSIVVKELDSEIIGRINEYFNKNTSRINSVSLNCQFNNFNRKEFDKFNFKSRISISFEKYSYVVNLKNDNFFKRYGYGESPSEEDINHLVDAEIRSHINYINQQIEKAKSLKS